MQTLTQKLCSSSTSNDQQLIYYTILPLFSKSTRVSVASWLLNTSLMSSVIWYLTYPDATTLVTKNLTLSSSSLSCDASVTIVFPKSKALWNTQTITSINFVSFTTSTSSSLTAFFTIELSVRSLINFYVWCCILGSSRTLLIKCLVLYFTIILHYFWESIIFDIAIILFVHIIV